MDRESYLTLIKDDKRVTSSPSTPFSSEGSWDFAVPPHNHIWTACQWAVAQSPHVCICSWVHTAQSPSHEPVWPPHTAGLHIKPQHAVKNRGTASLCLFPAGIQITQAGGEPHQHWPRWPGNSLWLMLTQARQWEYTEMGKAGLFGWQRGWFWLS